jgi:alpha-tubulin suppressor-like RCC1 family protein
VTPTITPSVSATPTISTSATPTISTSATPTISTSATPTISTSATPTITPSVSVTPSITVSSTPSVLQTFNVYSWGSNFNGITGLNTDIGYTLSPTIVSNTGDWSYVNAGLNGSTGIKNGALYEWGYNFPDINLTPQIRDNTYTWVKTAGKGSHDVMMTNSGRVFTIGGNGSGQIGNNDNSGNEVISLYDLGTGWKDISGGFFQTILIKNDGTLWGCGANEYLGINNNIGNSFILTQIGTDNDWDKVYCGEAYTALIKNDGLFGRLGIILPE